MLPVLKAPLLAGAAAMIALPSAVLGVALLATQATGCGASVDGTQQLGEQQWRAEQLSIAQVIVTVAQQRALPKRAAVLGIATGIVESGLHNLSYGDRDSLGVFQQRPSQGWGGVEQILNPAYATGMFYTHLLAVPDWATLPAGDAEQAVQHSGFPDRYAPQETPAADLVAQFWTGPDNPIPSAGQNIATGQQAGLVGGCPDQGGSNAPLDPKQLPPGFTLPADPVRAAAVSYALAQVGKPYVWGATGPDSFDCSGLMVAAWAHAGVAISRDTSHQVADGTPVAALAQAQPGDLLFIPGANGTPANPRHVGMYAGSGVLVDAYDSKHGVILESLQAWAPKVVAIRHVTGPPAAATVQGA